ncbi:MAG TPA: 6,7-dimethyl-8-ribityllumazine synthase [Acidimicrobiales bacterium]|nr:6,7-dimethyl-8-ribityllumazine synthase [Acidimicrobiales bacterium]
MTSSDQTQLDPRRVTELRKRVGAHLEGSLDGRGVRIAIVCSRFNGAITTRLLEGALDVLREAGVDRSDIAVGWVPGAFEVPLMALALADGDRPVDAVITLGAVIRGETTHYEIVSQECARGVQDVQLSTRVPVVFGVLTVENLEQALERSASGESNKGRESAVTALEMVSVLRQGSLGS